MSTPLLVSLGFVAALWAFAIWVKVARERREKQRAIDDARKLLVASAMFETAGESAMADAMLIAASGTLAQAGVRVCPPSDSQTNADKEITPQ